MTRGTSALCAVTLLAVATVTGGGGTRAASPADASLLDLVGEIQVGSARAVAADGATAYVGVGLRLVTLDLSVEPPARQGGTGLLAGSVTDVAVAGDVAVVAMGSAGLQLVNVADPAQPVTTARVPDPAGRVVAASGRAYALGDALRVYDLADPTAPLLLGTIPASANDFAVADGRAYLATGRNGLRILDVADPAAWAELGGFDTPGDAQSVVVEGSMAYVADGPSGMRILDVSDPRSPREVGAVDLRDCPGYPCPVSLLTVVGARAYMLTRGYTGMEQFQELVALDVSDPARPLQLARYDLSNEARLVDLVATGGRVFLVQTAQWLYQGVNPCLLARGGMRVLDSDLKPVAWYSPLASATALAATDTHLILVDSSHADVHAYDLADPRQPVKTKCPLPCRVLGDHYGAGALTDIDLADQAYVTRGPASDWGGAVAGGPANSPAVLCNGCSPPSPGEWFMRGRAQGDYTYLLDANGALRVFRADALQWRQPISVLNTVQGRELDVAGQHAFLVDAGSDLHVLDISDPAEPHPLSVLRGPAGRVTAVGSTVYLAAGEAGLRIVDVADPRAPVEIAALDTPGAAQDVSVWGPRAYVADGAGGLRIVNVADPWHPVDLGAFTALRNVRRVHAAGDLVHVLADGGAYILRAALPAPPAGLIYLPRADVGARAAWPPEARVSLLWREDGCHGQ